MIIISGDTFAGMQVYLKYQDNKFVVERTVGVEHG
jgi:hypothetical protein